jgi:hypothetical protein
MKAMASGGVTFKKLDGLKPAACRQPLVLAYCRENERVTLKNFLKVLEDG